MSASIEWAPAVQKWAPRAEAVEQAYRCRLCGYQGSSSHADEQGLARGNSERFRHQHFRLWKCPRCQTVRCVDPVDYADIYSDYPLNRRRLDVFARGTLSHLLKRLRQAGLRKTGTILDYGCGNGIFLTFLKQAGYAHATGYDPYFPDFAATPVPGLQYDCVIANDVLEHVEDPQATLRLCAERVKPGGLLYAGTSDAEGVEMEDLERHLMRLHLPFHRTIFTKASLHALGAELGLERVCDWKRSYMDTLQPFSNYRFLDEFNRALGHNLDRAFDPAAGRVLLRKPHLLLFAFLGYFFPSAYEPAVAWRKPGLPAVGEPRP